MRKATSMLELIIAIVVMGISVSALPLIITQNQNANAVALQQEVIMATKAKISYILSYEWDANSYDSSAGVSRVLDTSASASAHDAFYTTTLRRIGHVRADKRRRLFDTLLAPNNETAGLDDIDDFNGLSETTSILAVDDYIFDINISSAVSFISDGKGSVDYDSNITLFNFGITPIIGGPTNIKMITVNTTGANGMNVTLRAFSSNIGESRLLSKVNW